MSEEEEVTPCRTQTNKMIRVLTGQNHKKFTVTVHHKDGSKDEFQSNASPSVAYNDATRSIWLSISDYPSVSYPVMPWKDGDIIDVEQNPDWVEKKK